MARRLRWHIWARLSSEISALCGACVDPNGSLSGAHIAVFAVAPAARGRGGADLRRRLTSYLLLLIYKKKKK